MPRPVHFELSVENPERAITFYQNTFGWRVQTWEGPMEYRLVMTGEEQPGIDGGFTRRQPGQGAGTVNTLSVPNIDEAIAAVTRNGGQVVMPKQAIPGVGYIAYCLDTEGNTFGIMQSDESAR